MGTVATTTCAAAVVVASSSVTFLNMAEADWDFVFDGVVGFLTSPMWQLPVMNFVEKNCIGIFAYIDCIEADLFSFTYSFS